jgi:hypothetical protein
MHPGIVVMGFFAIAGVLGDAIEHALIQTAGSTRIAAATAATGTLLLGHCMFSDDKVGNSFSR